MKSSLLLLCLLLCAVPALAEDTTVLFGARIPPGWTLSPEWALTPSGARASGNGSATRAAAVPASCLIEAVFSLPEVGALNGGIKCAISVGTNTRKVTASTAFLPNACQAALAGSDAGGKAVSAASTLETVPSIVREQESDKAILAANPGWAGQTISLGLAISPESCRLYVNGVQAAELASVLPADRKITLSAQGIVLEAVQVLPGQPSRFDYLSGHGVAMLSGGHSSRTAAGIPPGTPGTMPLLVHGIPMLATRNDHGLAVLDISAEHYRGVAWSEGNGFLRAPVPSRVYSAAYLLVHRQAGRSAAMGFGLRPREMSAGEVKNIYLDGRPAAMPEQGVTSRPVSALGPGWYLVKVPLNPATLHFYTHTTPAEWSAKKLTRVMPQPYGARTGIEAYFCRPWDFGAIPVADCAPTPAPDGPPSGLSVAAVTLEVAGFDLDVAGNGLGNVYAQPETPRLAATISNVTDRPLTCDVRCSLMPFERKAVNRKTRLVLPPGGACTLDALAQPVSEPGHYRVRIVVDGGGAGQIDYRTNIALLVPDMRAKQHSPFGVWSRLWTDYSTDLQSEYLKKLAGIGIRMETDYALVGPDPVADDAAAEAIIRKVSPAAKFLMLGWEHVWTMDQTFAFPRLISQGRIEEYPKEITDKMDTRAASWKRVAKAARALRPDLKITLGNSAVNYTAPFLERGFTPGVDFDYWGTEEAVINELPESPADAVGNINWWTKAISAHYGFKDVPVFHSESIYYPNGVGFCWQTEKEQAANYARTYLLGFPYRSIYAYSAAMVDSSNSYVYSVWGMSGYCNQAPECSPKASYVAFSTLTQLLDGAVYDGRLDTGTTSLYALRFRRPNGGSLCAVWNLRGARRLTATLGAGGRPRIVDALNRPVPVVADGQLLRLTASEMPIYLLGGDITAIAVGDYLPQSARGTRITSLDDPSHWILDTAPDRAFELPREWRGMPKVMGDFAISLAKTPRLSGASTGQSLTFILASMPGTHGLIPRYVSLHARAGHDIPLPAGTTRLGAWIHGHSSWGQVKLGLKSLDGRTRLIQVEDNASKLADNFDGWRFLETDLQSDNAFLTGQWFLDRIVLSMPEQQVYVDELRTTAQPQLSIGSVYAIKDTIPAFNYLPW